MKKERVIIIYADTWEELTLKMIGWYHDHCWHYYAGLTADVPEKLKFLLEPDKCFMGIEDGHDFVETTDDTATCIYCGEVVENKKYVFLCEEDEPYKPKENEEN